MIPFAVMVEGEVVGKGRWVLAVEGERVLIAKDDSTLRWVGISECKLVRAVTPDVPVMVTMVVPQRAVEGPKLVVPKVVMNGKGTRG